MKNKRALAITIAFFVALISLSATAGEKKQPVKQPGKKTVATKQMKAHAIKSTKIQRAQKLFGRLSPDQMIKMKQNAIKQLKAQIKKGEGKIEELKDRIKKHESEIRELRKQKRNK